MDDIASLVAEIAAVSATGAEALSAMQLCRLHELTKLLIDADVSAPAEYQRFLDVRQRCLNLAPATAELASAYTGKRILVTGGTGCIGPQLLRRLSALSAGPLFSVSRGRRKFHGLAGVEYLTADVRDAQALHEVIARVQPEIVFHLAAQRDPGKAERAVLETVETNAVGTANLLRAARKCEVPQVLHASTGKAMRYYTGDVYAATKKLSEWLLFDYANEGRRAGGARFTHVVDNSIVLNNFRHAMPDGVMRVHDPKIEFYAQSASESAQLLLLAGIGHEPGLWLTAIRDLGDPVRLMSMALGLAGQAKRRGPPLCFTGQVPGYENELQPGLYDPRTALELSPLINALEAPSAVPLAPVPAVDRFALTLPARSEAAEVVDELSRACTQGDPGTVVKLLCRAGQRMAQATYAAADPNTLRRMRRLAERWGRSLPCSTVPLDDQRPYQAFSLLRAEC